MQKLLSYFSFQGRSNRQRYWVTGITIFMLFFLASLVLGAAVELPVIGILGGLLFLPLIPAIVIAILANGARRLHDRGKSAWWLILFMGVPMLLSMPAELAKGSAADDFQFAAAALAMLGLPFSIWGFVVMGCLKGTEGPNRFGDDPLRPAVLEVFA